MVSYYNRNLINELDMAYSAINSLDKKTFTKRMWQVKGYVFCARYRNLVTWARERALDDYNRVFGDITNVRIEFERSEHKPIAW